MKKFAVGFALGALSLAGLLKMIETLEEDFAFAGSSAYPNSGYRN